MASESEGEGEEQDNTEVSAASASASASVSEPEPHNETRRSSIFGLEIPIDLDGAMGLLEQLGSTLEQTWEYTLDFSSRTQETQETTPKDPTKEEQLLVDCSSGSRSMAMPKRDRRSSCPTFTSGTGSIDYQEKIKDEAPETVMDSAAAASPTRQKPRRKRSSVSFLPNVSVRCTPMDVSDEDRSSLYYSKQDIEKFKSEEQLEKKKLQEEEEARNRREEERRQEEKKLAKQRAREERKQRLAQRRASRSQELHLGLPQKAPQKIKRGNSSKTLSALFDKDNKSPMEKAEEDRDAISLC